MKSTTALVVVLALAACGTQTETESPDAVNAAASTPTPETMEASASPSLTDVEASRAGIPAALRGRWALVPDDCTSTRGDAKGLLTIDAGTLKFYKSRGVLGTVVASAPTHLVADFTFSGEGMTWTKRVSLDAQEGGNVLIRREAGEDAAPGPFRYLRCPIR